MARFAWGTIEYLRLVNLPLIRGELVRPPQGRAEPLRRPEAVAKFCALRQEQRARPTIACLLTQDSPTPRNSAPAPARRLGGFLLQLLVFWPSETLTSETGLYRLL